MAEQAKDFNTWGHYKQCCELNIVPFDGLPEYCDDSIIVKGFCSQCGKEYTLVYDLGYIETTGDNIPVFDAKIELQT